MVENTIVDSSKPNPGRIYDYLLGGGHNFEVDRKAAEQVKKLLPHVQKYARFQRWSLRNITDELKKKEFDVIIDFASGLPTNDHIHHRVPSTTDVIYSDKDPVTVKYAQEILGEASNAYVFMSDAARPEELLGNPEVQQILKGRRRVAFVYWGVSSWLSDEALSYAARSLYDWAESGSYWAFNAQTLDGNNPAMKRVMEIYKEMGTTLYPRTPEDYSKLIAPWQILEPGFVELLKWHGYDESEISVDDSEGFGPTNGGHGAYLIKP